jgi:hypothetical protein
MNEATPFACPTCSAEYKVVRLEAKPTVPEGRLACAKCVVRSMQETVATSSNTSSWAGRGDVRYGRAGGFFEVRVLQRWPKTVPKARFGRIPPLGFSVSVKRRATVALGRRSLRHSIPFRLLAGAGL